MAAFLQQPFEVQLTAEHFHNFIDQLVPVQEEWQTKKLRHLFNCFEMLTNWAHNLNFQTDFINEGLRVLFKSLLPYPIQVEVTMNYEEVAEEFDKMNDFLAAFENALVKRELIEEDHQKNNLFRSYFLYNEMPNQTNCVFCERKDHPNFKCPLNFHERINIIKMKGLCLCCLKRGHIARNCFLRIQCRHCGLNHYNYMCKRILLGQEASQQCNCIYCNQSIVNSFQ